MNKLVKEPSYNLIPERDLGKTPILECRRIGIDFGGLSAVDEFTIAIGRTEICGIIGPNGAGKTTIFNLLTNVYRPTRGSILVNGVDTLGMTTDEVNRRGVARTFQNIRLFKDLTVEENVLIGLHNSMNYSVASSMLRLPKYWKQEKEARERVRELLHIFHMENMTAQQAGSLPYGAQRRLEIVRSLATNPGILLLDEPAAGMNPSETAELMETIRKIRDEFHIAIMLIEHVQLPFLLVRRLEDNLRHLVPVINQLYPVSRIPADERILALLSIQRQLPGSVSDIQRLSQRLL